MGDSTWKDEILAAAKKWPRLFRARLDTGTWHLTGANEDVQREFTLYAKRIWHEVGFPQGDVDPATGLLYRLTEQQHHVRSSQQSRRRRVGSEIVISNRHDATLYSVGTALIEYLSQKAPDSPNAKPRPRASARSWGQAAAGQKNRQREARELIVRALQKTGCMSHGKLPDFIQEFSRRSDQTVYRQPIAPAPFQSPAFDRLNQSPEDWVKAADAAWQRHRDRFQRACGFWVEAGVDDEIPTAKRARGPAKRRSAPPGGTRGNNTPVDQRYEWAAKYLAGIPLKEIAAEDSDPSTVGRIAREILRTAGWLTGRNSSRNKQNRRAD